MKALLPLFTIAALAFGPAVAFAAPVVKAEDLTVSTQEQLDTGDYIAGGIIALILIGAATNNSGSH
jgi:hypothetical protein